VRPPGIVSRRAFSFPERHPMPKKKGKGGY
jgi:hypothetical protein